MTSQSLSSDEQVDVLIVGGGPSGLSAALSLQHFVQHGPAVSNPEGISNGHTTPLRKPKVLIVDALSHGQNESRALLIHARTLESLEIIGCASTLLPLSIRMKSGLLQTASSAQDPGSRLITTDFSLLEGLTQFPCGLLIPQHVTERGLIGLLEGRIHESEQRDPSTKGEFRFVRGLRMTGMKEEERVVDGSNQHGFLVTFETGQTVWTRYLVGADGSKSVVRTLSQIPFSDPSPSEPTFFSKLLSKFLQTSVPNIHTCLADVIFSEDLTKTHKNLHAGIAMTYGPEGIFLIIPIRLTGPDRERYLREMGLAKDDGGEKYWYRIGFLVPDNELDLARGILEYKKMQEEGQSQNGSAIPDHRDVYQSTSEAIEYLEGKIAAGARYIPSRTGASSDPEDLPIGPSNPSSQLPRVKKVVWASTFRVRHAVADTFHKSFPDEGGDGDSKRETQAKSGHVLLVGDAGHVHSPAGGQGMNLGIRDGIECGKAIAEHFLSTSSSSSNTGDTLSKFASSRRSTAIDTIKLTRRFAWIASMRSGSFPARMRDMAMWLLGLSKFGRKKFVWSLSGLGRD